MPEKLKSKWKFFPYMQKQDIADSNFKMYNKDLKFNEILVLAEYDEDTNFFNLKFYNKKLNELEEDYAYNAFYIMLEHAVGENISKLYLLGDVEKVDKKLDGMIELTKLYDFIMDILKNKNKDIITDPINRYTVYECKPTDNFFREDIFIGNTCYMEIINDYANYNIDAVVNISKMGARAAYLVYVFSDNENNDFDDKDINKDNERLEKMVRDTLIKEFSPKIKDMKSFNLLVDATVHNIKQKQLEAMGDYEEIDI